MADNPALSRDVIARYCRSFSGAFYRRFVLGEWVAAEGRVYDFFDERYVKAVPTGEFERWCVSCDYGTVNPASFGLWGLREGVWYRTAEYYFDSRAEGRQKTDGEYAADLARLVDGRDIELVVVDPSAASFIETLRREGWRVARAENDVLSGIRLTAQLLREGKIVLCASCGAALREMQLYCWDTKARGCDRVKKEHDHAMDEMRYFAATVAGKRQTACFGAGYIERGVF